VRKALLLPLVIAACSKAGAAHAEHHGTAMGAHLDIEVFGPDQAACDRAVAEARGEIDRLEQMMTDWKAESPLMEVNRHAGERPVKVPPELFFVIRKSLEMSELTRGAFDISFAAAGKLWNWRDPRVPTDDKVRVSLTNVGWRGIRIDATEQTVFLEKPGMRIGLGAIAPGYAGDRAIEKIRACGIRDACVNMSGDVMAIGMKSGAPWRVALKHPRRPSESVAILPVANAAVSTSGDYERFFEVEGKRYCHIIDPRTGRPAEGCQSVTIVAPVLAFADGLATGVFVLGPEAGMKLVESLEGVEAVIVASDGRVLMSPGLRSARNPVE
jgi:thiamine biosynthesis lipoprotein